MGGYSSSTDGLTFYSNSLDKREVMQKPSIGLDLIQKVRTDSADIGTFFLESRLAWSESPAQLEPQLYNGYFRAKTRYCYVWAGHNRTAAGLESYFDTHASLLQVLPMYGYGFDRDWGAGASRDLDWGDAAFSLTSGSGMPLHLDGNYLFSGRVSKGVLNQENYNAGFYFSGGRIPDVAGYSIIDGQPRGYSAIGADFTHTWDRYELRADARKGEKNGFSAYAVLARLGVNFLAENRLKIEFQQVILGLNGVNDTLLAAGISYAATADLTWRSMFEYDRNSAQKRVVTQLYYYFSV